MESLSVAGVDVFPHKCHHPAKAVREESGNEKENGSHDDVGIEYAFSRNRICIRARCRRSESLRREPGLWAIYGRDCALRNALKAKDAELREQEGYAGIERGYEGMDLEKVDKLQTERKALEPE